MSYIILTSYVFAIIIAIIYTVITLTSEEIDKEGLLIMWGSMILCGWVLGIVTVALFVILQYESLNKKKMKLIKLNEEDYIIVDDLVTDVKDLDVWVYDDDYDEPLIYKTDEDFFKAGKSAWRITYSTKPLEDVIIANKYYN